MRKKGVPISDPSDPAERLTVRNHVAVDADEVLLLPPTSGRRSSKADGLYQKSRYIGPKTRGSKSGDAAPAPVCEDDVQRAFITWARKRGLLVWHTPNQTAGRTVGDAVKNRSMGVLAGVADVIIADRLPLAPDARGLAIEFKFGNGKQSPQQIDWQHAIERAGWLYYLAWSAEDAKLACMALGL